MDVTYNFQEGKNKVFVNFHTAWLDTGEEQRPELFSNTVYCTITVRYNNGKVSHYHGGTVCHPNDRYNRRTAYFVAFKRAMRQRWEGRDGEIEKEYYNEKMWKLYYRNWSHFLATLIDGKVDNDSNQF